MWTTLQGVVMELTVKGGLVSSNIRELGKELGKGGPCFEQNVSLLRYNPSPNECSSPLHAVVLPR